jgi:pimeloyl-ACP methyl ester carboxylesterase
VTTWILLRGLARERRHWGGFPSVRQLPSGDTVACVDLPGNGEHWREASPVRVAAMVEAVRRELRARGHAPPYAVVALSLGGMVALQWAAARPLELAGCVLVNSSAGAFSPPWHRLRPGSWFRLLRWLLAASPEARERAVFDATSRRPPDEAVIAEWAAIAQSRPVSARNVARQLLAAARFRAPSALHVPVLLVTSRGDRLVSHRCSATMARVWHLPLREHPWAGHDLALDDPGWLARVIAGWEGVDSR